MPIRTRSFIALFSLLLCSGCVYPVYKTLQPDTRVTVIDQAQQPISGALVSLTTSVHHVGKVSLEQNVTNDAGQVSFPARNEWRAETTMLHGATDFSWDICIEKPGYQTYIIPKAEETEAMASVSVTLYHGVSTPCPQ